MNRNDGAKAEDAIDAACSRKGEQGSSHGLVILLHVQYWVFSLVYE